MNKFNEAPPECYRHQWFPLSCLEQVVVSPYSNTAPSEKSKITGQMGTPYTTNNNVKSNTAQVYVLNRMKYENYHTDPKKTAQEIKH